MSEQQAERPLDLSGGCLCGAVRYRASGVAHPACNCHCRTCQQASGAPFVAWITFRTDDVSWLRGEPKLYASSPQAMRGFCAGCGTPLTFRYHAEPQWLDLTVASLDDPNAVAPIDHIWTRSQLRWVELADELPRHPERRPRR